ncbi:MAG: phenylacetate-CoA oxygenase subunit PaaC [Anaerolineales bacterium]|nr:phenylacetate-CoA oxygenase subunit PaaC [Anaerolineales bacterium]
MNQVALIDLLFRLADDELLVGHRNSEWTGVAPIIEEDIAFSSMAQDEMGHALAYYTILHERLGQAPPDQLAFLREPHEFRNAALTALPRRDWSETIVRQFLYDAAEHVRLECYAQHPFEPLAHVARKIHGEEKYHFLHARTWMTRLAQTDESRQRMQVAIGILWPHALGMFETGQSEQDAPFDEASIMEAWLALITPILVEAGYQVPSSTAIYSRYAAPTPDRIELLAAMQKVYRIDPNAEW